MLSLPQHPTTLQALKTSEVVKVSLLILTTNKPGRSLIILMALIYHLNTELHSLISVIRE